MSGFVLKVIACICMLIDHIAEIYDISSSNMDLYLYMKIIGRLAFVVFAYFIVEGYQKTSDVKKYMIRLIVFAFVSEVPFDKAFNGSYLEFESQNVFFTLFMGLLSIMMFETFKKSVVKSTLFAMSIGLLAEKMNTDYGYMGVWLILFLYVFREEKNKQYIAGSSVIVLSVACRYINLIDKYMGNNNMIEYTMNEIFSCTRTQAYVYRLMNLSQVLPLCLIWVYNGKRGYNEKWLKYSFYIFYPAHIMIIYFIHLYC